MTIPRGLLIFSKEGNHAMPSIHHEVTLPAPPSRVYEVLVDSKEFAEVTGAPASGDGAEGAAFSGFGGHVTGRHVELVPGKRVVQAWRAKTWPEGVYSIVRFDLRADGKGTKLVFDHDGFPEGAEEHLSAGWQANYWERMAKHLA
jgi:activator of HSP90 ATPase